MKTTILKNILALILMFATGISFMGCATSPTRAGVEIAGTQNALVQNGMKAFAEYSNAGHTTQAQIDQVHAFYDKYRKAVAVERDALLALQAIESSKAKDTGEQSKFDEAKAVALACEADLITFLKQFIKI